MILAPVEVEKNIKNAAVSLRLSINKVEKNLPEGGKTSPGETPLETAFYLTEKLLNIVKNQWVGRAACFLSKNP
jgi:hypothetical protein